MTIQWNVLGAWLGGVALWVGVSCVEYLYWSRDGNGDIDDVLFSVGHGLMATVLILFVGVAFVVTVFRPKENGQ